MADQVDVSRLERRISDVVATTQRIEVNLQQNTEKLNKATEHLADVSKELHQLQQDFVKYMDENKKATALQKAATELIRVRQELEHNFGSYKVVRGTMLGVLQATDLALVKKTTISQVTEELMLATPDYWLAPCLVGISAWIGNDRDLADRAIAEAVKRDEEKTALTMALICRRNNRTATCYEWLSIYFARQSATKFTESNFAYLNAYLNGVFGPDEKHMCDDYAARWMNEVQRDKVDLVEDQSRWWSEYCATFTVDLDQQFPLMNQCVQEYSQINDYISRIDSVERISNKFTGMQNAEVDQQALKKEIDKTLVELIGKYDACEEPLRKEEAYLKAVRKFDGNVSAAKQYLYTKKEQQKENTIDLISQMSHIITDESHGHQSERKTAVNFLRTHIKRGFDVFITEKKADFPKGITMAVGGWTGSTINGANQQTLVDDYKKYMEAKRQTELQDVPKDKAKKRKTWAVIWAVIGVILLFSPIFPVGIAGLVVALFNFLGIKKANETMLETFRAINTKYNDKITQGEVQIGNILQEWNQAQSMVSTFESVDQHSIVA